MSFEFVGSELACSRKGCNGGRAFEVRANLFCSPLCANTHYNLNKDDEDYWSNSEEDS